MRTKFIIENFRVFDNEGTFVPLRPITILTGCNNSGKSSITKALCLLKDFCQQLEADFNDGKKLSLDRYKMDFQKMPNSILGSFDRVLHHGSSTNDGVSDQDESSKSEYITFTVVVESSWLLQNVILEVEFCSLKEDELNNGYLHAYSIRTLDGKLIYQATRNGKASMDFSIVKKSLLYFLYGQHAASELQSVHYAVESKETEAAVELFDSSVNNIYNDLGATAEIYLLEWQMSNGSHSWKDDYTTYAESILKEPVDASVALNSPSFGVFCYYPCMHVFRDMNKSEIRQEINNKIASQENPINERELEVINTFLDAFEESDAETLHDYISQKENDRFFINPEISPYGGISFGMPNSTFHNLASDVSVHHYNPPFKVTWSLIVTAMDLINKLVTGSDQTFIDHNIVNVQENYRGDDKIDGYLRSAIEDIFAHLLPGQLTYSPTTIVESRRMYSLEDNSDFAKTLKDYFDAKRLWETNRKTVEYLLLYGKRPPYKPCSFINKWIKQFGIADHVEIKPQVGGYGVTIHLYEDEKDNEGMMLADKGFGVAQLFAILLKIETAIINSKINDLRYDNYTDGFNDEFVKDFIRTYCERYPVTVAMEEPECHLHPSLQSKFAEMIVDANKKYGVDFIIESHSEYFIRNMQIQVSQEKIKEGDLSLLYVNPADRPSHIPTITDIGVNEDGTLKNEFGPGFFDEAVRLSKELYTEEQKDNEE